MEQDADCLPGRDLSFATMGDIRRATGKFRDDPDDPLALDVLNSYRRFRLNCIRTSLLLLRDSELPDKVLVSARLKRLKSIYRKLRRSEVTAALNEMDDIIGFRVICESLEDASGLGGRIGNRLNATMKNYIKEEHPAELGYRAIHGITRFDQPFQNGTVKVRFEIQVRTWYQHLWACWCESHGEQAKEGYPNVQPDDLMWDKKLKLRQWSDRLCDWENSHPADTQKKLPSFCDPYHVAIAWFNSMKEYNFEPFGNDISSAVNYLTHLETRLDIELLLLVGVAEDQDLEGLLRQTHPNFTSGSSLDPQYWMPTQI